MKLRVILTTLLAASALAVASAPASAETAQQAVDAANAHDIQPGCGRGANWSCLTRYPGYTNAHWNYGSSAPGDGFWDIHGYNQDWHWDAFPNAQDCDWYVHRRNNATFFVHDWCRGDYFTHDVY